jgi:hypothetical protein
MPELNEGQALNIGLGWLLQKKVAKSGDYLLQGGFQSCNLRRCNEKGSGSRNLE